jgi:hypothetical protein
VVAFRYHLLDSRLNILPDVASIERVNPSVHEAKAVGGADDGIAGYIKNGAMMNLNEVQITAEAVPRRSERFIDRREDQSHNN